MTTPIMLLIRVPPLADSLKFTWTSGFAESIGLQELSYIPLDPKQRSIQRSITGESSSVHIIDQHIPFLRVQVSNLPYAPSFKVQHEGPTNNLPPEIHSVSLDPAGGSLSVRPLAKRPRFLYEIFCCIRPSYRCCINELPVEILDNIFMFIDHERFEDIQQVCTLWKQVAIRHEIEPDSSDAHVKLSMFRNVNVKRLRWFRFFYDRDVSVDFHEYLHAVLQYQPYLTFVNIQRPNHNSPLDDLLILAKAPSLKEVTLKNWKFHEVLCFLQARPNSASLHRLEIIRMIEESEESDKITLSDHKNPIQGTRIHTLSVYPVKDSMNIILDCLQRKYLQNLRVHCLEYTGESLKEPLNLSGFTNLTALEIYGGHDESNIVSFDFIYKVRKEWNIQNLKTLCLHYCFINPEEVEHLLHMSALTQVRITLFMGQKVEGNVRITSRVMDQFQGGEPSTCPCNIWYGDGTDR